VMATVTFGIYELYWFYKNWKLIKQRSDPTMMPFWRAFFGIIFCYGCFKEIKDTAAARGITLRWSAGLLAITWIVLCLCWRLPDPFSLVCWLTPLVILPVQDAANRLNAIVTPNHNPNVRFSGWNIAGIVLGGICFVLSVIATFLPS